MRPNDDLAQLYRVARYYYIERMSQNEIGKLEDLSRSQISRLLDKARAKGIVDIKIQIPQDQKAEALAGQLGEFLGVKVYVMPTGTGKPSEVDELGGIRDVVSLFAPLLSDLLAASRVVGVGWGRAMYHMPHFLNYYKRSDDLLFVPLMGNAGTSTPYLQTSTIVDRFSEKFFARSFYVNLSETSTNESKLSQYEQGCLLQLRNHWNSIDTALIGLGQSGGTKSIYVNDIPPHGKRGYPSCGELLGYGLSESGDTSWIGIGNHLLAYPVDRLKSIQQVIAVACDVTKAGTIYHAARHKLYTSLVTDLRTAQSVLDLYAQ